MIRPISIALALSVFAGPALSLSCMRPDAVRMFEYARDSSDTYYVIKGQVKPQDRYALPNPEDNKDGFTDTTVQITGVGLGKEGFSVPIDIAATARLSCLSVWCAGPPPADEELLMIVKTEGDDLILEVGPCGGTAMAWEADAQKRVLECHLSNNCQPAEF